MVLGSMQAGEAIGGSDYETQPEVTGTGMAAHERSHDRLLTAIAEMPGKGARGEVLARLEGRHRATSGNALRAAVLGANDGLVSNLSLVMGVAGAALDSTAILITGLAGLLAGSGSMAMGEWLSVQSHENCINVRLASRPKNSPRFPKRRQKNWHSSTRRKDSRSSRQRDR
ncbi:VIT1/CCC1 transporter family protein [Halomicroarcula sp. GCM10025710]